MHGPACIFWASLTPFSLQWLLEHDDTDAFNSLLQVCRPRTEDPLLLKAIASLVQVRTVMLDLLYLSPPYTVFGQMLDVVLKVDIREQQTGGSGGSLEPPEPLPTAFIRCRYSVYGVS